MVSASVSAVPISDSVSLQVSGFSSPEPEIFPELENLTDRLSLAENEVSNNRLLTEVVENRISEVENRVEKCLKDLEKDFSEEKCRNSSLEKTLAGLQKEVESKNHENSEKQLEIDELILKSEKDSILIAELTQVNSCLQDKLSEAAQQRSLVQGYEFFVH